MKKRSCRRSVEEEKIHARAVQIRKMTDEQLIRYLDDYAAQARSEGYEAGQKEVPDIDTIIEKIGNIKGIGKTKLEEIKKICIF